MKITIEGLSKIVGDCGDFQLVSVREWNGAYEFRWVCGEELATLHLIRDFDIETIGDYTLRLKLNGEPIHHHISYLDLLKGAEVFRWEMYTLLRSEYGVGTNRNKIKIV